MKKLLWNKDIGYWILGISLFFIFSKTVHAQETEIPGPEIKEAGFIQVKELNIGDVVFVKSETGELVSSTITKLEYQQEPVEVYNLSVAGEETFFANDFAVHNKPAPPESPACHIVISQQIVADGKMATYNPYDPSHQDSGLVSFNKLSTISGKDLFYMGKIPFEMDPLYPLEQVASVCFFGHSNRVPDYGDDNSCGNNPINQPPLSRNLAGQNAGGACKGDRYGQNWYLHPQSNSWKWGCPYWGATGQDFWRQLGGNFLWLYGGAHVTINPPANNLVYKISFNYNVTSGSIIFSRHYRTEGTKVYWNPLAGGTITGSGNDKVVFLSPASDSLHILAEGDALLSNIQVTFINISSATGTVDNKVTIVNNSYGNKNSSGGNQGIGSVWLSNVSNTGPWTQVVNYSAPDWNYLAGRSDYTRMGYEWNLGSTSGTRTVWARVEGVGQNVGLFSTCWDTISFTPAPPPTGTITGTVKKNETNQSCNVGNAEARVVTISKTTSPTYNCTLTSSGGTYNTDSCPSKPLQGYVYNVSVSYDGAKESCFSCPTTCSQPVSLVSSSATANFTVFPLEAWFQTQGGDVHAAGEIRSQIPSTASDKNFSMDLDNYPGLVSYNGSNAPLFTPAGVVSSKGWLAKDSLSLSYGYDYFKSKLGSPTEDNFSCDSGCPTPPARTTIYYSVDSVLIEGNNEWEIPANTKVVVLINGDLNISLNQGRRITVPVGSFLAFIVKENINIAGNVGSKTTGSFIGTGDDSNSAFLQGVYLTDGIIDTYVGKDEDTQGLKSGFRFVGAGLFYAAGGFKLQRDLKSDCTGICNENTPAELFIARPDLFVNIPEELKTSYFFEQEVAP